MAENSASKSDDRNRGKRPLGVLVRYGAMGWIGEFSVKPNMKVLRSTPLVIQTDRGIELGQQIGPGCGWSAEEHATCQIREYVDRSGPEFCRFRAGRVLREATAADLGEQRHLNAHIDEDIAYCAQEAAALGLDMKVVTAEHLLGGERIVFYFGAPGRIDFRQLVKSLAQRYRTRIEMRQVGARDEARLVADYEVCGRECCCKNFLKKLRPVNMKMAKLQKSTLDPTKVSGRCGRLRCCLRYEHVGYEELVARLPRTNSRVDTECGPATVVDRQVLTQLVMVRTDDERYITIPLEEIKAFNLPPAQSKPKASPPPSKPTESGPAADESAEQPPRRRERRSRRRRPRKPTGAGGSREQSAAPADARPKPADEDRPSDAPDTRAAEGDGAPSDARAKSRGGRRRRRRRNRKPDARGGESGGGAGGDA